MKKQGVAAASLVLLCALPVSAQVNERVIYASVVDDKGAPIPNVTAKDIVVREDGQAREILNVQKDSDPLQVALLIDNSVSMRDKLPDLRKAVSTFVTSLRPGVQLALFTLAERPTIVVNYTADHAALLQSANRLVAYEAGNYALDGIAEAAEGLSRRSNTRSIVVVVSGTGPELSYRHYSEVIRTLRDSGASLHALLVRTPPTQDVVGVPQPAPAEDFGPGGGLDRDIVLGRMTKETGGRYEELATILSLAAKLQQLSAELSNQYRVTFARPERLIPPRSTEISARQPSIHVRGTLFTK